VRRDEVEEELIARLRESVRLRMIADVPLGAFLSGGVDSSGVVAMMAGLQADPVSTFSISFGTQGWDESAFSREVAEPYGTDHHVRAVDPNSFDLLDRLATIYDEPFGDSSAMPTFRVCAAARENVTVALSGDGGGEVFAGYRRYRWHCFEERVRRWVPGALRRPYLGCSALFIPSSTGHHVRYARRRRWRSWRAIRSRRTSRPSLFAVTSFAAACSARTSDVSCKVTMPPTCSNCI
jgi:asparagine synthase (glutamine-hydrolysing)